MKGWVGLVGSSVADGLPRGQQPAAGRAQDRESSPTEGRRSIRIIRIRMYTRIAH